ncbi:MAG: hypothetical protein M0017_08660 [Desulfobacteraceae bacterium]|nr:hypothetical protein [Desulfobacteraceae bacterium]
MEPDIAKVLGYEIKKELADRYFGFRKLIEEDKESFAQEVHRAMTAEQKIGLDLARIYILLRDEGLIRRFLDLTGLEEEIFYDRYLVESPTIRERVFEGVRPHGLTRRRRFLNLVLDGYRTLEGHVGGYREQFGHLSAELETIKEEISLFYRKNNLGSIMNLLRNLDAPASGNDFYGGGPSGDYEEKLRIEPPAPLEQQLPIIPPLVPFARLRRSLKKLAASAYARHS